MSIPFDRLRRILISRPRASDRLEIPAALGATDGELARLGAASPAAEDARRRGMALIYGGSRPC